MNIIKLPEPTLSPDVIKDLELLESDDTDPVFNHIDLTSTTLGKQYLQRMLIIPSKNKQQLTVRQSIIKEIAQSNVYHEIGRSLQIIKENESVLLWLFEEHPDEINEFYNKNYFTSKYLTFLNQHEQVLQIYNFYRIVISPMSVIVYPVLIFLSTYLFVKFIYKINIPFRLFLKIFFKLKISNMLFLSKSTAFLKYFITLLSLVTYFYSIYNCLETAITLNRIIHNINDKMNSIITVLDEMLILNKTTCLLMNTLPIQNPFPYMRQTRGLSVYSNKGKILYDFKNIQQNLHLLHEILFYTAKIDAYYSIAKLSKSLPTCFPTYNFQSTKPYININNLWNPVLSKKTAVQNSIHIKKNILITGPNKGGKSTFIKALMLSVLFAQTLTISFADTLVMTPFSHLQTYLNIPDCKGKTSLFEAEMNRAYQYIQQLDSAKGHSLIIMDEIFSSTNPREGLSGAYAIANKLSQYPRNISVITTHFTELALLEKHKKFKNYKIPIHKEGNEIVYPYKLEKGVSQQYIAIQLLKEKGFDKEIIKVAREICKKLGTISS